MTKQPSVIGGACIIGGVCVGAGMLGLPSAGAGAWTIWSSIALLMTMLMMTASGWFLLEAYKNYDLNASFSTVTKDLLGSNINLLNNLSVYFVGGILLYAYTTASGGILTELAKPYFSFGELDMPFWSILFVLGFSFCVWHSTRLVDRLSVLLIIFMAFSFLFSTYGLVINIDVGTLFDQANVDGSYAPYAIAMFPVALTSFGYHHSVSTMRAYYGEERKAQYAILGGTLIALALYLLWVFSIFGNLPRDQFAPIIASNGDLDVLLNTLGNVIQSDSVKSTLNAFSMAAILSSFIGVGLGMFDFLADFFQFDNSKLGRAKSWAVTFLPPLLMSLFFPLGFLKAIGYAGAIATVWACIIPALLAYKVRQKSNQPNSFQVWGGIPLIILVVIFGIFTAVAHLLAMYGYLPIFSQ